MALEPVIAYEYELGIVCTAVPRAAKRKVVKMVCCRIELPVDSIFVHARGNAVAVEAASARA